MKATTTIHIGALLGALAVALGAFGAHALKNILTPTGLDIFEVGVRYQMYHALALLLTGLLQARGARGSVAAIAFTAGTLVFSGSLYALVLLKVSWLGAITPIGGVLLIVGWIALARAGLGVRDDG